MYENTYAFRNDIATLISRFCAIDAKVVQNKRSVIEKQSTLNQTVATKITDLALTRLKITCRSVSQIWRLYADKDDDRLTSYDSM